MLGKPIKGNQKKKRPPKLRGGNWKRTTEGKNKRKELRQGGKPLKKKKKAPKNRKGTE